jgi:hypothetical protein
MQTLNYPLKIYTVLVYNRIRLYTKILTRYTAVLLRAKENFIDLRFQKHLSTTTGLETWLFPDA